MLHIGSLDEKQFHQQNVEVPLQATVDDLISELCKENCQYQGCSGFFATARHYDEDCYGYYDDEENTPPSSGLAQKLTENCGTLLKPGDVLSGYGLDSTTCREITLFAVFSDLKFKVFKKDIVEMGFGDDIYKYVVLNKEDKELTI